MHSSFGDISRKAPRRKEYPKAQRGIETPSRLRLFAFTALLSENAFPMRWSQYFVPTLREDPADAEVVSHKLLLRAGIVRQLSAGIYSYLPLGQRIAVRVMQILREEMNASAARSFICRRCIGGTLAGIRTLERDRRRHVPPGKIARR